MSDYIENKLKQGEERLEKLSREELIECVKHQGRMILEQNKKIIPENIEMHNKLNEIKRILKLERNPLTSEYHYDIVRLINDLWNIIEDKEKTPEEYIEQNITNPDIARRLQETIRRNMESNNE